MILRRLYLGLNSSFSNYIKFKIIKSSDHKEEYLAMKGFIVILLLKQKCFYCLTYVIEYF